MKIYRNILGTPFVFHKPFEYGNKEDRFYAKWKILGALYTENGELIEDSVRRGGTGGDHVLSIDPLKINIQEQDSVVNKSSRFYGKSLFLGNFMDHYGHFITEFVSRLSVKSMDVYDNYIAYPFIFNGGKVVLKGYHVEILRRVGIDINKLYFIHESSWFEEVHVPDALWHINRMPKLELKNVYQKIISLSEPKEEYGKIFISRKDFKRFKSVSEVEVLFEERGFKIIYPEDWSFSKQLEFYKNCFVMAGFSGSGLHNSVFTKKNTLVINICDKRTRNDMHIMQKGCNSISDSISEIIKYDEESDKINCVDNVAQQLDAILSMRGIT